METLDLLLNGLVAALSFQVLLATFLGVLLGLAVGVLPALGPAAAIAILLPIVFRFEPTTAMAGLAGLYYGTMYGGAVTSILLGIPGESASMMTTLDGYPMARRGEAGRALGMSVYASFIGGLIALVLFTALATSFARYAVAFGPAEMTALIVLALTFTTTLGGENMAKGFCSLALGLWIGMIGMDMVTGAPRFTFGSTNLLDGIDFSVVAIGVYGLGQFFADMGKQEEGQFTPKYTFRSLFPRLHDIIVCWKDLILGSVIGFLVGVLPGAGATAATIFSYAASKKLSKHPEKFGKGAIEGIASPEAANNAASYANMIPLFALGIPGSGTTAVMLGGLLMLGLQPGPLLFTERPDFIWPLIGTFYVGNVLLVVLTILLTPILASIVYVPLKVLVPIIAGIVGFGVYSINYSIFDIWMALGFGVLGYIMTKLNYSVVPLMLGVVLGPLLEQGVRRALISSGGDPTIFVERPIALALFALSSLVVLVPLGRKFLKRAQGRLAAGAG
ncbi:MAG: TctA subunit of the tripartite Tricarboxylate transport(TTT) family protein [Pelagibacterium sp. SCN 64-44]|nr:MAG: TctA subunit of the tripartite Tricarboxylate transport(TTT) family protein [Pelagibacterium sp. SCN 64-44]